MPRGQRVPQGELLHARSSPSSAPERQASHWAADAQRDTQRDTLARRTARHDTAEQRMWWLRYRHSNP